MKWVKKTTVLASPLLLFAILLVPYSLVNRQFIVDWLGCGCPVTDALGNMKVNYFSANDFTALFWLLVCVCAVAIAVRFSVQIPKEKMWGRVVYVLGITAVSLLIARQFYYMMQWR